MNQKHNSNELEPSEDERPSVSDLLFKFEKLNRTEVPKSKSLNNLVFSFLSDSDNDRPKNCVQGNISHDNENISVETKEETYEQIDSPTYTNDFKKPPVPQKSKNLMVLPPTPTRRKTVKDTNVGNNKIMKNPPIKMENIAQGKTDLAPPLPPRIYDTLNDVPRNFKDIHKRNNISPDPYTSEKMLRPINRSTSHSSLSSEGSSSFDQWQQISEVPLRPPRRLDNLTRESIDEHKIEDADVALKQQHKIPINILPLRPKSMYAPEVNNKSITLTRTQTISATTRTKAFDNKPFSTEKRRNYKHNFFPNSAADTLISEDSIVPPLPPKSLALRRMVSVPVLSPFSGTENRSDLGALVKLNELKSIFSLTSAGKSNKFNKSILLLIDIMVDAIQESSADMEESNNEIEHNAWYSNIKEFVHQETKEYIKENKLRDNNLNIPYDKLLNTMVPKFIENYINTDNDSQQNNQNDDDEYEKVVTESQTQVQYKDTPEKISKIIEEIKQTETYYLNNLESYIIEYSRQESLSDLIPTLENLLQLQCEFKDKLEQRDDVFWLLNTFLDFEDLFALYVNFCCNSTMIGNDESVLDNHNFNNQDDLSTLLLNRLTHYRLSIKNIFKELTEEEENKAANKVMEMLIIATEKCYNVFAPSSISDNLHNDDLEGEINDSQDDSAEILSKLMPAPHDFTGYGSFLFRNNFKIDNTRGQFAVFLFKRMIIVTKEISWENFMYKYGLKLDQFVLLPPGKNKKVIKLKDYFKSRSSNKDVIVKLEADTEATEKNWRKEINTCLWEQLRQQKQDLKHS